MKKRISSVLLCLALLLSVVPTSVLAAASEIEIDTYAMLSKDQSAAAGAWEEFWEGSDIDPTDLYVWLDTSPAISDAEGAAVLTFELPELTGWKCVGYYYWLENEDEDAVTLDGTIREIDWKKNYFDEICMRGTVDEQAENIQLKYTGTTPLSYVDFYYLMAPADQKSTASLTFENVFDGAEGDHGADEWNSSAKALVESRMPNVTAVYTGQEWTIPAIDSFNTSAHPYEYWQVTKCTVTIDENEGDFIYDLNAPIEIPENSKSVKVTYYWRLAGVTNVIEPLERVVKQNGTELSAKAGSTPDTYAVAGKDKVTVDYTATMDMSKLDSGSFAAGSWDTLKNRWDLITDETVVYLNFTFDENINLSVEDFQKAVLTSDMFTFDEAARDAVIIEENTVKLTCHWDSQKAAQNMRAKQTLDPIIKLNGVTLKIKDTWQGDSVTIKNEGSVTGYVHTTLEGDGLYGAIYGGYQSDKFVLTTQVTLSYDANGGEGSMESQTYTVGDNATVAANSFTRSGYTFTGWNTKADGTGTAYKANDTFAMPASDVTLYAQWEAIYYPPYVPGESDKPALNTEDHVAYIIGYPVDYVTGAPTDDMSRWPVKPQGNITRAEVATIFFRLLTDESRAYYWSQTNPYSDVGTGNWFNNAISTLSNAGIITGYPDGTFRPNAPITRAEFAAIAARFSEVIYNGGNSFTDVPENHWAARYIALAEYLGWINGYPDGTFKPEQNITRAESMTLINRVLERDVEEEHMLEDMVKWPDNLPGAWYYEAVQEATNSHEYVRTDKLVPEHDFNYEDWQEILEAPDWAALEKAWSTANSK